MSILPYLAEEENLARVDETGVLGGCPTFRQSSFRRGIEYQGEAWLNANGNGYGINSRAGLPTEPRSNAWDNPYDGTGTDHVDFRLGTITEPTRRILFGDYVNFNADMTGVNSGGSVMQSGVQRDWYGDPSQQFWGTWAMDGHPIRHRGSANYGFFDGHVQSVRAARSQADGEANEGPGYGLMEPGNPKWKP